MKFFATLSLVALVAMPASVLAKSPKIKFTPWVEEHCQQPQRVSDDETLKQDKCRNFDPFRSYQVVTYKRTDQIQDYCVLEVYSANDCKGEHLTVPNINKASNVCTAATFPFNNGVNSGRSARFVCNKPAPAKPVQPTETVIQWTTVPLPVVPPPVVPPPVVPPPVSSASKVEETKVIVPPSPSASVTTAVYFQPIITSILTSQTLTFPSSQPGPSKQSSSTQETSTVTVPPTSASSTSTVWVSPPSTTLTVSFTTAFGKNLPRPTKRAEEQAF